MQRNEKIRKFFKEKGLYIGLGLCAVAVAVSGWLFCRETAPETRSVSPTDVRTAVRSERVPDERLPIFAHEGEDGDPETGDPAQENGPEEDRGDPKLPDESGPAKTTLNAVSPVGGELAVSYSMDRLSYNPTTRDWRTHAGADYLAPLGTEVSAAADGVVLAVYDDDLLGRTVTVRHAGGWVTHYSNLEEEADVMAGDRVTAGQVLGRVGSTALLEIGQEPHLHFAVYRNNVPKDPEDFLNNP